MWNSIEMCWKLMKFISELKMKCQPNQPRKDSLEMKSRFIFSKFVWKWVIRLQNKHRIIFRCDWILLCNSLCVRILATCVKHLFCVWFHQSNETEDSVNIEFASIRIIASVFFFSSVVDLIMCYLLWPRQQSFNGLITTLHNEIVLDKFQLFTSYLDHITCANYRHFHVMKVLQQ